MAKIFPELNILKQQNQEVNNLFRPEFFNLNEPARLQIFEELLKTSGLVVLDTIRDQVREFLKFKNPSANFEPAELEKMVADHIGHGDTDELKYGNWIYYPWTKRLVHILGREEFIDVRTSRNQYKITPAEREILAGKKIGVIGLSVGQSVSVTLAMERICGELRLADFDLLELTNLNRIRTGVHNLGLHKVYSVAREIAEIDPYIDVKCFPDGLTEANMDDFFTTGGKLDLVVEESDGFDVKIQCRYKARALKVPVIMEASDRCMVDVERFDLEPGRQILHGIVKNLDVNTLKSLKTNEEKIPYMLDVLGFETTTARLRASMLEMRQTINTWPQLASAVTMGGGITADVSRRMLLNQFKGSGRYYVDIEQLIGDKPDVAAPTLKYSAALSAEEVAAIASKVSGPVSGDNIPESAIREIVEAACLAPSYANAQPWLWISNGAELLLVNTQAAGEFYTDPDDINLMLSFGAAIQNAVLTAAAKGYAAKCTFLPFAAQSRVVAGLLLQRDETSKASPLCAFIDKRCTNRNAGNGKLISSEKLKDLTAQAERHQGVRVIFPEKSEHLSSVARITGEMERLRLTDPVLNAEYFQKIISSATPEKTGIGWKNLQWPPQMDLYMQVIKDPAVCELMNTWELGTVFSKYHENLINQAGAVGFLSAASDKPRDLLACGMALQELWLRATQMNFAIHPISLPLSLTQSINSTPPQKKSERLIAREQLSIIFSGVEAKNVVLMFRVHEGGVILGRSPRKPVNEALIMVN